MLRTKLRCRKSTSIPVTPAESGPDFDGVDTVALGSSGMEANSRYGGTKSVATPPANRADSSNSERYQESSSLRIIVTTPFRSRPKQGLCQLALTLYSGSARLYE